VVLCTDCNLLLLFHRFVLEPKQELIQEQQTKAEESDTAIAALVVLFFCLISVGVVFHSFWHFY
jgi:hypothetical protein